jgi:hypothetical protein
MQNVVSLHFNVKKSPTRGLLELFKKAWLVFGARLERLSLYMGMESWKVLADSKPSLPLLKTLRVHLGHSTDFSEPDEEDSESITAFCRSIAAFINSMSSQIEILKLRLWPFPPHSALVFSHLRPFPALHSLELHIDFTRDLQQDPSGLSNLLLKASRTLRNADIHIFHSRHARALALTWLEDITSNPLCFSQISSLSLYPINSKIAQQCISNSYKQLTSLSLINKDRLIYGDKLLSASDIVDLSASLSVCQQLSFLQLGIEELSSEIFDAFARDLPGLQCLSLACAPQFRTPQPLMEMGDRIYPDWTLCDLTIWEVYGGPYLQELRVFSQAIPRLRTMGQARLYETRF